MKWYIGQRIVAIKDHSQGFFKKGDTFIIKGLKQSSCRCGHILIDIGIVINETFHKSHCVRCGHVHDFDASFFSERCFAPLDEDNYENVDISEITEILQQPLITTQ